MPGRRASTDPSTCTGTRTVTQASAVWELAAADPTATRQRLFTSAMRIGRDHIASSVYTLVLAYAGSAIPVLLPPSRSAPAG